MKKITILILLSFFALISRAQYPQTLPLDYKSFFATTAINPNTTDLVKELYTSISDPIKPNQWGGIPQSTFVSPTLIDNTLSYSTYIDNNAGKAIVLSPNRCYAAYSLTSGSEYTGKAFYLSALINFSAIRSTDNFLFFSRDHYGNYSRGRLCAITSGSGFQLGLQINTETVVSAPTVLSFNQTYLIILKIVPAASGTETLSLFINPVIGNNEPFTPDATTSVSTSVLTKIGALTLRTTPTGKIAGLRFSDNWADATGKKLPKLSTPTITSTSGITSTGFTANWMPVSNATSYELNVFQNGTLVKTSNVTGQTASTISFSGPSIGYTYTYNVVAIGDAVNYADSEPSVSKEVITTTGNQVVLANVFSNNMVLQQDLEVSLWGWGAVNDNIQITASWGQTATATVNANGKWIAKIQTPKAISGQAPKYTISFKGTNNTVTLSNVLIGDVWVCSGQSNMAMSVSTSQNGAAEVAAAVYPNIRLISIGTNALPNVQNNATGSWVECNSSTIPNFSAVAYYFGRELHTDPSINIPIGLINTSWGSATCEAWMRNESLITDSELKSVYVDPFISNPASVSLDRQKPSFLYNAMLAPIIPYGIKGAIWYQGEANAIKASTYTKLCSTLIQDWRTLWGLGDFPFYYVQLPAYNNSTWPALREAQTNILTIKNTGMAVTLDVGELDNIHPLDKQTPGKRLALWAKAKTYGQNIVYSGPVYKSNSVQDGKMIINYLPETTGGGLISKDGSALTNFQISGADNVLYDANAVISGNTVIVSSPSVPAPVKVWFAYTPIAKPNLTNIEGLIACPFRTDNWNDNVVLGVKSIKPGTTEISINFMVSGKTISVSDKGTISIYSLTGKQLLKANNVSQLNTNLSAGMYIVRFANSKGHTVAKKILLT